MYMYVIVRWQLLASVCVMYRRALFWYKTRICYQYLSDWSLYLIIWRQKLESVFLSSQYDHKLIHLFAITKIVFTLALFGDHHPCSCSQCRILRVYTNFCIHVCTCTCALQNEKTTVMLIQRDYVHVHVDGVTKVQQLSGVLSRSRVRIYTHNSVIGVLPMRSCRLKVNLDNYYQQVWILLIFCSLVTDARMRVSEWQSSVDYRFLEHALWLLSTDDNGARFQSTSTCIFMYR